MLDTLSMQILDILHYDARSTSDQIARLLGRTADEVEKAIAKLEAQKIILCYSTLINWQKTEIENVQALIEVKVTPQRDEGFDGIASRIYRFDEVTAVYLMSGGYDLMVTVKAKTLQALAHFVSTRLSVLEGVQATASHFILKKYKEEGIIFDEPDLDTRLAVSP